MMTLLPLGASVISATRLAVGQLGTKRAACLPRISAASASSRFTDGSCPKYAQPTSAVRMAAHISSVGAANTSERRSIRFGMSAYGTRKERRHPNPPPCDEEGLGRGLLLCHHAA